MVIAVVLQLYLSFLLCGFFAKLFLYNRAPDFAIYRKTPKFYMFDLAMAQGPKKLNNKQIAVQAIARKSMKLTIHFH